MTRKSPAIVLLAIALTVAACAPKREAGTAAQSGDILVGEYGSLTGPQATFGQSTHNGIMMAVDSINAAGGVKGRKIKIITEDDQSKPEEAANAVTKLISEDNVVAILGEVSSSNSLAAAPICQADKIPMLTPSSTNPKVTTIGNYIFRTSFTDKDVGENIARYVFQEMHLTRAAILTDVKTDYSTGLTATIEKTFTSLGGQIIAHASYSNGDSDFRSQLTAIKQANPQVIFLPGYYTDVGQIAIQARDLGMKQPFVGGDGWVSPKLIEIGGKALEGCLYADHYFYADPTPVVRDFVQAYKDRYGAIPDGMAALAYDAAGVMANALGRATKLDGPSIRDALATTKNFAGVTGNITIGPDRNAVGKKMIIEEVRNGQPTLKAIIQPNAGAIQVISPQ